MEGSGAEVPDTCPLAEVFMICIAYVEAAEFKFLLKKKKINNQAVVLGNSSVLHVNRCGRTSGLRDGLSWWLGDVETTQRALSEIPGAGGWGKGGFSSR